MADKIERTIYMKDYYQNNKKKLNLINNTYYKLHKDKVDELNRLWKKNNPMYMKDWYKNNPDYYTQWRQDNREKTRLAVRKWQENHREESNMASTKWKKNHREESKMISKKWKIKNYSRVLYLNLRRRTRKLNAEGSHTFGEWELLKKQYGYNQKSYIYERLLSKE